MLDSGDTKLCISDEGPSDRPARAVAVSEALLSAGSRKEDWESDPPVPEGDDAVGEGGRVVLVAAEVAGQPKVGELQDALVVDQQIGSWAD